MALRISLLIWLTGVLWLAVAYHPAPQPWSLSEIDLSTPAPEMSLRVYVGGRLVEWRDRMQDGSLRMGTEPPTTPLPTGPVETYRIYRNGQLAEWIELLRDGSLRGTTPTISPLAGSARRLSAYYLQPLPPPFELVELVTEPGPMDY